MSDVARDSEIPLAELGVPALLSDLRQTMNEQNMWGAPDSDDILPAARFLTGLMDPRAYFDHRNGLRPGAVEAAPYLAELAGRLSDMAGRINQANGAANG